MIKSFLLPPGWIFLGLVLILGCLLKNKVKIAKVLLIFVLGLSYLLSIAPISYLLTYSLEKVSIEAEAKSNDYNQAEAIVVLGGMIYPSGGFRKEAELVGESLRRIFYGIKIYRDTEGRIPIIFTGGPASYFLSIEDGENIIKKDIYVLGVPEKDIIVEIGSKDTYESAVETKKILDDRLPSVKNHQILLVTSALHMLRASMVFEKQGFGVLMFPAGYETGEITYHLQDFIPSLVNFERSNSAIYEWLGMAKYKVLNKI